MSETRCEAFERWLGAGDPSRLPDAWRAHASDCARCAAALARARALDTLLAGTVVVAAPAGFTDAVMARLDDAPLPARAPVVPRALADPMPLAVRIAMEPAVALALVLAALCVWQGPRMLASGRALAGALAPALAPAAATHAGSPLVPAMSALALAPLAALAAWALYRGSERLGAAALARPPARL